MKTPFYLVVPAEGDDPKIIQHFDQTLQYLADISPIVPEAVIYIHSGEGIALPAEQTLARQWFINRYYELGLDPDEDGVPEFIETYHPDLQGALAAYYEQVNDRAED